MSATSQEEITDMDIPRVTGKFRPVIVEGRLIACQVVVRCPYCGKLHMHGIQQGIPQDGDDLGHRTTDCDAVIGYYVTVSVPPDVRERALAAVREQGDQGDQGRDQR